MRLRKYSLLLRSPIIASFGNAMLKIWVHHLLLNCFWLGLNILAYRNVSFGCLLIKVSQAMWALHVGIE
jgi:hypothetical protein